MSNPNVGPIYQQIIEDVIETSRVDFEEGGVDESVLEELRQGWQQKLSAFQVAQFPWDPKPEPIAPPASLIMGNQATNYQQSMPPMSQAQTAFSMPSLPPMQPVENMNGPRIKSEPGLESSQQGGVPPSFNSVSGTTAQQRAANNLTMAYGNRAAASISAIQGGMPQQQMQPQNVQQQIPQQNMPQNMQQQQRPQQAGMQQRPAMTQAQYQEALARQMAAQRNSQSQQGGVNGAQTDGAGDVEEGVVMTRINDQGGVEMGRVEIDNMIREQIEANGRAMEGGGLMLPLKERYPAGRNKKRKLASQVAGHPSSSLISGQYDGAIDDDDDDKSGILKEEDDEDAINSDLDDPDDGLNDEEDDDEGMGHIMLCMYDKVQRVKNKWKCVMKDGVLTVNGREYVFHKASGEYEW